MWVLYGLLAAITAALMTIVGKVGLKQVDPTAATALRGILMALFLIGTVALSGKWQAVTSVPLKHYAPIALAAVFGALSWLFYFLGLQATTASKLASLDRLSLPFIIVLSVLALQEPISARLVIGGGLVTVGAILIATA